MLNTLNTLGHINRIKTHFTCLYSVWSRYLQATKAILTATNNQAMTAKADSCKEEMDEAHNKVEICKVCL